MAFLSDTVIRGDGAATRRPRLHVERLAIRRGRTFLVRDFSWTHRAGRIAWVVGRNGAGKSSLLRALAGLDSPASGRVRLDAARPCDPGRPLYYHPRMRPPRHATLASWTRWCAGLSPR
ncbi:MAG: ABC transporter ATP-binding protein, partial [Gemmatimonadota bacterium]